jgi:hypothetical protein
MTEPKSAKLRGLVGEGRQFMVGYELLSEPQRDITAETAPERLAGLHPRRDINQPRPGG